MNGMAAETACQHSGLSSQAIITLSVRSLCRRAGANTTGRRVCSSDCSAMAMSDSITEALAATTRSKAAARCTAISTYDPSASRQDAASGLPGSSFADSIGMPGGSSSRPASWYRLNARAAVYQSRHLQGAIGHALHISLDFLDALT